jgi:hypothetical protein
MLCVPEEESLYRLKPKEPAYDLENRFNLDVEFMSWNGECLGYDSTIFKIPPASGTRKIQDLAIYPLKFHADPETMKETCRKRGEKFVELCGVHA